MRDNFVAKKNPVTLSMMDLIVVGNRLRTYPVKNGYKWFLDFPNGLNETVDGAFARCKSDKGSAQIKLLASPAALLTINHIDQLEGKGSLFIFQHLLANYVGFRMDEFLESLDYNPRQLQESFIVRNPNGWMAPAHIEIPENERGNIPDWEV